MISITFPDESVKQYENPLSGLDVAKSISEGLARNAVAMALNGTIVDLNHLIDHALNGLHLVE